MKALWLIPNDQTRRLIASYQEALKEREIELTVFSFRDFTLQSDVEACRREMLNAAAGCDLVLVTIFPDSIECSRFFFAETR